MPAGVTVVGSPGRKPRLPRLLDRIEATSGPTDPPRATDGWRLVLAENVGYLVDEETRWHALGELERVVGLQPDRILAASEAVLRAIVVGAQPLERVRRLRRCAELAIAAAPWRAFPGIGRPGAEGIELFAGTRAVLALDANGLRVLTRLGYAAPSRSYDAGYREAQSAAGAELPATVRALTRAHLILRRHGQQICRRKEPACGSCPVVGDCPSAGRPPPLY
jgi:hypothetical protein